ncbi:uncharacterized protein [Primulina huaijiensis]|uniref:uncharacterized protein n=1 Tax=Primulina huaijiensis TaxID=1492673 RepID=UPI003CC6FF0D
MSSSDYESSSSSDSERSSGSSESSESSPSRTSLTDPEFTLDSHEEEVTTYNRPGKEVRHVNQQMNISEADNLWYGHLSSHIPPGSESKLRNLWHIPSSHHIIIPSPEDRPYLAPKGYYTFFQHHFDAGLRFPLCDFFQELSKHYQVHLGLLTPNAFRLISCFVVLLRALDLPLSCTTFSYFLVLSRSKEGPFYVTSRSSHKLFDGAPSHVKDWKKYYFFIQPPKELTCFTDWYPTFTKPDLSKDYKKDKEYLQIMSVLGDRCFSIPQLLSEDLLCHAGLSPAKIKLKENAGTRVMNALFLREIAKKKTEGSSSVPQKSVASALKTGMKGTCSTTATKPAGLPTSAKKKKAGSSSSTQERASSPPPQAESHPPSGKEKTFADPGPSIPQKSKRKISEISATTVSSPEAPESDDGPITGPSIHPLYTPESVIVGRGPSHLAQKILYQLPSHADATFMSSLGWSDLTRRTCSSIAETTLDEAKATHVKELSESQAQCGDLLKEKQEFQLLIEDHAKENQKLKEELKNSRAELKDAKARHAAEASSFKEEFLKSEEFVEICGPKAFHYLGVGFEGAVSLFKAQGYPPPGAPTDFIDLEGFISSLPPDS